MTVEAFETDNGPGGMSWEVQDSAPGGAYVGSAGTIAEAMLMGATVFHDFKTWEREQVAELRKENEGRRDTERVDWHLRNVHGIDGWPTGTDANGMHLADHRGGRVWEHTETDVFLYIEEDR